MKNFVIFILLYNDTKIFTRRFVKNNLFLMLLIFCIPIFSQDLPKIENVFPSLLIKNVNVFTKQGFQNNSSILINEGIIKEIGGSITPENNTIIFDGKNSFVYPGFINGALEIEVKVSKDTSKYTPGNTSNSVAGINPKHDSKNFISSRTKYFQKQITSGFTTALVFTDLGMITGKADVINFHSEDESKKIVIKDAGVLVRMKREKGVSPAAVIDFMEKFRQLFNDAIRYKQWQDIYKQGTPDASRPNYDEVSEILVQVLDKKLPLLFEANKAIDILRVLKLRKEYNFDLVLLGGKEAWKVTNELKESNIPVILSLDLPENQLDSLSAEEKVNPSELEKLNERPREERKEYWLNASKLKEANILFAFGQFGLKVEKFHKNLVELKNYNLTENDIINGLTKNFAEIFPDSEKMGALQKGVPANLFLTDKNYFKSDSKVLNVFINGIMYDSSNFKKKNKNYYFLDICNKIISSK